MRLTVERSRTAILVVGMVLVAAIAIFLAVGKYARQRLVRDLPAKLGVQIQESADSFTLSKSDKKHTIFTIHASKAVQYKGGGHAVLHDVSITLYGAKGDRADRIYGSEFDYDPKSGIATATGEVDIDLEAPAGAAADPDGSGTAAASPATDLAKSTIHVKTSGLVFDRDTGTATTHGLVEFRMPQGAGHAMGASFDSQAGVLVLDSAVQLDSSTGGKAFSVAAQHAQILRDTRQVFLLTAVADYESERIASDEAIVYFRPDGSAEHVDAKGHVKISGDSGQELKAQTAMVLFDEHSQPVHADIGGGIFFVGTGDIHHMHGDAVEAKIQFGQAATLRHVQLLNAVSFVDQQVKLVDDPNGSTTREIRAAQVDVEFVPDSGQKRMDAGAAAAHDAATQQTAADSQDPQRALELHSVPQKVLATGNAVVVLHTISSKHPQQNTTIGADQLLATLANGNAITGLNGTGHTQITNVAADGASQTTKGDSLKVDFAITNAPQASARAKGHAAMPASQIASAEQQGNVTITQTPAVGAKDASIIHITAQRADYRAGDRALHLDGSPRFSDGALDLTSNTMDYERATNQATATGNVKATYLQTPNAAGATAASAGHPSLVLGGQGPAHIVSDTATINRATGDAVFRGHARLWQGANSISAPVIELSRAKGSLKAHGDASIAGTEQVETTLSTTASSERPAGLDRIGSRELDYSEADRMATFSGSVTAQSADGTIHSDGAVVYLVASSVEAETSKGKQPPATGQRQSQIDHVVATGHVVLDQPGRRATGDKLVYVAREGLFTLTGTALALPKIVDQVRGTVSGASLSFNSRDDSVNVSGGQSRASTDTRTGR